MRFTGVEIANYRGFAGDSFKLTLELGENLLVYGENGAGKSSLYNSLKDFLHAAGNASTNIAQHRNRDNPEGTPIIRITTDAGSTTEWAQGGRGQDSNEWRNLDDGKGFLDYRALLRFYTAPHDDGGRLDLFKLLLEGMLAHHRMQVVGNPTFLSEWRAIKAQFRLNLIERKRIELQARVRRFSAAFQIAAELLAARATEFLHDFDPDIGIAFIREREADFTWYPKKLVSPRFFAEAPRPGRAAVTDCQEVFNEARLSAMALSLFFAALETCPIEGPRLLVLDDVLIGLDMANRHKVVDLVQRLFPTWQIIILTYHKAWFEILKERTKLGNWNNQEWRSIVLRPEKCPQSNLVIVAYDKSGTALEIAEHCVEKRDHKAAAVYARTALEAILHHHCAKWNIAIRFAEERRDLDTDDYLNPIKEWLKHLVDPLIRVEGEGLIAELHFARRTVLNAFAHGDEITEDEVAGEVSHAIEIVRRFGLFLTSKTKDHYKKAVLDTKPTVAQLLLQARHHVSESEYAAAGISMQNAIALFVEEYPESIALEIPYKRNRSLGELFSICFPETAMDADERSNFRRIRPYLFGNFDPKEFNQGCFDDAVRLIFQTGYGKLIALLSRRSNLPAAGIAVS